MRACSYIPFGNSQRKTIERLPVSLQASRSFLKKGHSGKALGESHVPVGMIYKIYYNSTMKRTGATVEDVTPGTHMAVQYGHPDYYKRDAPRLLAAQDIKKLLAE